MTTLHEWRAAAKDIAQTDPGARWIAIGTRIEVLSDLPPDLSGADWKTLYADLPRGSLDALSDSGGRTMWRTVMQAELLTYGIDITRIYLNQMTSVAEYVNAVALRMPERDVWSEARQITLTAAEYAKRLAKDYPDAGDRLLLEILEQRMSASRAKSRFNELRKDPGQPPAPVELTERQLGRRRVAALAAVETALEANFSDVRLRRPAPRFGIPIDHIYLVQNEKASGRMAVMFFETGVSESASIDQGCMAAALIASYFDQLFVINLHMAHRTTDIIERLNVFGLANVALVGSTEVKSSSLEFGIIREATTCGPEFDRRSDVAIILDGRIDE